MREYGVYIHVPFCVSKCPYCDFYSESVRTLDWNVQRRYVRAVEAEAASRLSALTRHGMPMLPHGNDWLRTDPEPADVRPGETTITSVYVGGGTPTVLDEHLLADLISVSRRICPGAIAPDCEVTCEANPGTVDPRKMTTMRRAGVTRVSLGFQSTVDSELKALGRAHTSAQAMESFRLARGAGFPQVSVDLMFGVPGQSLESWRKTLARIVELGPDHVSAYCLTLAEGTPLAMDVEKRVVKVPDEKAQAGMYETTIDVLKQAGFDHYEISNFARKGCQCRHNLLYWAGGEYVGLGASAHSHLGTKRSANTGSAVAFIEAMESANSAVGFEEELDPEQIELEKKFLGLRTMRGADLPRNSVVLDLVARQLLEEHGGMFRLTRKGKLFADTVVAMVLGV
ncbi:MAG: radical SAM family heme chaperone HemW [Planctomycetota bacterium]|nr:radical SAM family heme chaperone HemW [Planctomycetota bacterium]